MGFVIGTERIHEYLLIGEHGLVAPLRPIHAIHNYKRTDRRARAHIPTHGDNNNRTAYEFPRKSQEGN